MWVGKMWDGKCELGKCKLGKMWVGKIPEQITDGLKKVANQKKNAVDILNIENQQLKDRNYIFNTKL